jgi:hypothetical protein
MLFSSLVGTFFHHSSVEFSSQIQWEFYFHFNVAQLSQSIEFFNVLIMLLSFFHTTPGRNNTEHRTIFFFCMYKNTTIVLAFSSRSHWELLEVKEKFFVLIVMKVLLFLLFLLIKINAFSCLFYFSGGENVILQDDLLLKET